MRVLCCRSYVFGALFQSSHYLRLVKIRVAALASVAPSLLLLHIGNWKGTCSVHAKFIFLFYL